MKEGRYGPGIDGGRIAARGLRYQYLRTLESMLGLVEDPRVAAVRVEGPPSHKGHADAVDFDVLDVDGRCRLAVQVKSKAPGASASAAEVFAVLVHLVSGHDAVSYQLLTNGAPASTAQQLAEALSANVEPTRLRDRLAEVLAPAPARLAQLRALQPEQLERLARCCVLFDARDDVEILESLRENLRAYRNRARSGLGQRSAGVLTGYLVSEILRRAADGSDAVFTIEELRSHLLVDAVDLARVSGIRDWGVVIGPMPSVPDVARPALLRELVEALDVSGLDGVRRVALVGLSGVGKSTLAADYVADRADFYDWISWVDGETAHSMVSSFRRIAGFLRPGEAAGSYQASAAQVRDDVHTELSRLTGRWAIIFDNVGDQRQVEPWIPRTGRGDVIITSIDSTARHGAATVINVGVMEQAEAVELLGKRLKLGDSDRHHYAEELCRLANGLSSWPLALELASGYLDTCGMSIHDVDHYLEQLKIRSLADVDSLPPDYPRTLAAALSLCLEQLHRRIVQDGDRDYRPFLALNVVTYAAFLASRQLPIHMLAAAIVVDPEAEAETTPVCLHPSDFNLGEVIRELRRFSLVSFDGDLPPTTGDTPPDGNRTITINSIVQDLIRVSVDRDDNTPDALNRLANHVVRWLMAAIELNRLERASVIFNHANTLAGHLLRLNIRGKYIPYLYGNLAGAYRARGEASKAEEFLRAELDVLEESSEPNELLVVQAKLALVDILFDKPEPEPISFAEAAPYLEHALRYVVDVSAEYLPAAVKLAIDVKTFLSRPTVTVANDARFAVIEQKCDELIAQLGPTSYSEVLDAVRKANSLMQENQPVGAEQLCRDALRSRSLSGGIELTAQRVLVEALVRQRKWQGARKAFSDFRQYFGPTRLHLYVIADFVHNVGNDCAVLALTEQDQDAIALLGDVFDWPVISQVLIQASSGQRARIRLLAAICDLVSGDHRNAKMIMKTVRPADLRAGAPNEVRAWCMLWKIARLAAFRVASRTYIHASD
jgi:hypothetical protein